MPNNVFVAEFERYRRLTEGALAQVADEHLARVLGGNSVAVLVRHLTGNLRSRFTDFLTTDGEKPWRARDGEFEESEATRAELVAGLEEAWNLVFDQVRPLGDAELERTVTIRGKPLTVGAALARSTCHVAYHVGQIVTLARHFAGESWASLSIPPGESEQYNRNPTLE